MIPGTSVVAMMPCRLRDPVRDADRPHVVRAEKNREHDAHRGDDEGGKEGPAEVVDGERLGQLAGDQEDECVRDQHEQEAEDERERQPQRGEDGRDDGVQRGDDRCDDERTPEGLDFDPGRSQTATISATPVANHETRSGNNFKRGRSGCQEWPYVGSGC